MVWIRKRIEAEYRKHKDLDWARIAEQKVISQIMEWCYKNNTIKFKESKLRLATTDGGWIYVLELQKFLKEDNDQ